MSNVRSLAVLVGGALVGACAVEAPSGPAGPQRTDSAGVEIVVSGEESRFFELQEELRIGVVTGEEAYQFAGIWGIDVSADGRILVTNAGTSSLRLYSPEGRFLVEMGGPGDGPGEFRFMRDGELVGDSIIAIDYGTASPRITVFHEDGELGRTLSLDRRSNFGLGMTFTDSVWYARLKERPSASSSDGDFVDAHWTVHRVERGSGAVGSELHRFPGGRYVAMGGEFGFPPLFDPALDALPYEETGAIIAAPASYEVRLFGNDGALRRVIRRVHTPVAITDDELAHHRSEISARYREEGRRQESLDAALDRLPRPGVIPPIASVSTTDGGELWIHRQDYGEDPLSRFLGPMAGQEPSAAPVLWDAFAADGSYRGSVWIPSNFQPRKWGSDWVIGVHEDELEVEFVVRYRLTGPVAPPSS